jgi:hypothetical protein
VKLVEAVWTPIINWLIIECDCGNNFKHRSDRWWPVCDFCGRKENLGIIRERYVDEKSNIRRS